MTDYADLKAKAEAVRDEWIPGRWFMDSDDRWEDFEDKDAAYIVASSPDVVLSLLAENERLVALVKWHRGDLDAVNPYVQEGRPA